MTLQVGITSTITASKLYSITRPMPNAEPDTAQINHDLLVTGAVNGAKGVQIEVARAGLVTGHAGHPGVVFNCNGRLGDGAFQSLSPTNGGPGLNPLWVRGRGIIFLPNGVMKYERWFHGEETNHGNKGAGFHTEQITGNWTQYGAVLVTCTTNPNGSGALAVYGTTGLGGTVQVLLWSTTFTDGVKIQDAVTPNTNVARSIPPGIYASVFALGTVPTGPSTSIPVSITARPRAIFN